MIVAFHDSVMDVGFQVQVIKNFRKNLLSWSFDCNLCDSSEEEWSAQWLGIDCQQQGRRAVKQVQTKQNNSTKSLCFLTKTIVTRDSQVTRTTSFEICLCIRACSRNGCLQRTNFMCHVSCECGQEIALVAKSVTSLPGSQLRWCDSSGPLQNSRSCRKNQLKQTHLAPISECLGQQNILQPSKTKYKSPWQGTHDKFLNSKARPECCGEISPRIEDASQNCSEAPKSGCNWHVWTCANAITLPHL